MGVNRNWVKEDKMVYTTHKEPIIQCSRSELRRLALSEAWGPTAASLWWRTAPGTGLPVGALAAAAADPWASSSSQPWRSAQEAVELKTTPENLVDKKLAPNQSPMFDLQDKFISWVETDSMVICSCYFSPNALLETFEKELAELKEAMLVLNKEMILGGDFNAKSAEWSMPYEDRRGEITTGWIAEMGLIVLNKGNKPTFERGASSSIIDLTLATEAIARKCNQWEVLDEESLSLHNYITCNVDFTVVPLSIRHGKTSTWILKLLDKGKFNTALQTLVQSKSITNADDLVDTLTAACNQSMPRRTTTSRRSPVYWWTQEIGELRRDCLKARRAYTKKNLPEHVREIRGLNYRLIRQKLRATIKSSKSRCWKKLIEEVDDDIWGKGYRIVFKRINIGPSLPTMSADRRRLVAEALFPSQPRVVYNTQPEATYHPFTSNELFVASEKLKAKKSPGVDCIPAEIIKIAVTEAPDIFLKVCNNALSTDQIKNSLEERFELMTNHSDFFYSSTTYQSCLLLRRRKKKEITKNCVDLHLPLSDGDISGDINGIEHRRELLSHNFSFDGENSNYPLATPDFLTKM
ncbi:unnamed protein product, partial [Callosobruchus maculatus]